MAADDEEIKMKSANRTA